MPTNPEIAWFIAGLNDDERKYAEQCLASTWEVMDTLSKDKNEAYLTISHIDTFIKWSIKQLTRIKQLVAENNTQIDAKRLTIKNNLVCIDGFTIPAKEEDTKRHHYKEMQKKPKGLTYPGYAKVLLNFAADITGTTFIFPANRDKLQKGEIDREVMQKEINTPANQAIIKTLHSILWFDSLIPVWLDKEKNIIYIGIRSDNCVLYRHYNDYHNSQRQQNRAPMTVLSPQNR